MLPDLPHVSSRGMQRYMTAVLEDRLSHTENRLLRKENKLNQHLLTGSLSVSLAWPMTPFPRTVSSVPDKLHIRQCLSFNCSCSPFKFSILMLYLIMGNSTEK